MLTKPADKIYSKRFRELVGSILYRVQNKRSFIICYPAGQTFADTHFKDIF